MDVQRLKRLRASLSLHFVVLAFLTAMLVASGSGSLFLPTLIFCVGFSAFIFVDTLEWFAVGRWGSYFLMTVTTCIAISQYVYTAFYVPDEQGQLMAVASLLVFPEAVLLLQKKNLRVFEQLAIFLLLEMIVAALVNDNIIFGFLLAPIMLLWVSSLFLFARYATLVHIDPTIDKPIPHLAELIAQRFRKTKRTGRSQQRVSSQIVTPKNVQRSRLARRLLQSIPIGAGAIAFAGFFFYLMPRTSPGSLRQPLGGGATIGLPKVLTMGIVGQLKADPTPVLRIAFKQGLRGKPYPLKQQPYIRARVMDTYIAPRSTRFVSQGQWVFNGAFEFRRLPSIDTVRELRQVGRDFVDVEVDIKRQFLPTLFSLQASYLTKADQRIPVRYDKFNSLVADLPNEKIPAGKSAVYRLGTACFSKGRQVAVTPAVVKANEQSSAIASADAMASRFTSFVNTRNYASKVLLDSGVSEENPYLACRTLENHFVSSGEFSYSLDLTLPAEASLDPMEDFIANKRVGHCQYFASSLVVMMRQLGVRSRIVVGYRPREFNKQGQYFSVRQSDAHAWVEALFEREDLVGTDADSQLTDAEFYWVRFDPTPPADEFGDDIIEQEGQTLDYAEKLWKDYVVDGQKLSESGSLYDPVAEGGRSAIEELIKRFTILRNGLNSRGINSTAAVILVPLVIVGVMVFLIVLVIRQLPTLLPKFAPRLARKLGVGPKASIFAQPFFARCIDMLQKAGFRRSPSATPREFVLAAADRLSGDRTDEALKESLNLLSDAYYQQRFAGATISPGREEQIRNALSVVEQATTTRK